MNALKKIAGKIHLWLGLVCGLIVVVSCSAAAVFVWERELRDWYYYDEVFAKQITNQPLAPSVAHAQAMHAVPNKAVHGVDISNDSTRNYIFYAYMPAANPGVTMWSEVEYYDLIYVDRYSGETHVVDMTRDWLTIIMRVHIQLALPYAIGHRIVGVSSLIILIMIVTGLVLWWPKTKAAWKQRFTINWKAKWRRVNYDIHSVGGFYAWLLIAILSSTGLVWTFDWWNKMLYAIYGGDHVKREANEIIPSIATGALSQQSLDLVFGDASQRRATWDRMYIGIPQEADTSVRFYTVFLHFNDHAAFTESDEYFYRKDNGAMIHEDVMESKTVADKLMNSNYEIHVGSIYGLPTKIMMCLAALFCASLPVTGFYIWWGRRFKKKTVDQVTSSKDKRPATKKHCHVKARQSPTSAHR